MSPPEPPDAVTVIVALVVSQPEIVEETSEITTELDSAPTVTLMLEVHPISSVAVNEYVPAETLNNPED